MMTNLNRNNLFLIGMMLVLPLSAHGGSWNCEKNNLIRDIRIERSTSDPAPCEVIYAKESEGFERQVLWSASNDGEYCEDKAKDFVEKLQTWGWECIEDDEAVVTE